MKKIAIFVGLILATLGYVMFISSKFPFQLPIQQTEPIEETVKEIPKQTITKDIYAGETFVIELDAAPTNLPEFITYEQGQLNVAPLNRDHLGDYSIQSDLIDLTLNIELPPVDVNQIKRDIVAELGENEVKYGIYIKDHLRGVTVELGAGRVLPPASISKVPVALLVLRDIDSGKLSYADKYPILAKNKPYSHDAFSWYANGTELNLHQYLQASLIESDNTANATLEDVLGGYEVVDRRTKEELGVETFFRKPHEARAIDVGHVIDGVYTGEFLSNEQNEYMIKQMLNTAPRLQDGIPYLLPEEARVAHKTGQLPFYVWEDAGIVYGKNTDFTMVVLNNNIKYSDARIHTRNIAKFVYDRLNNIPSQ